MLHLAWRGLIAHKLRFLTTALAIALGVAFMGGTLVLTDTVTRTFDNLFANVYKGTDAVVRAEASFKGPADVDTTDQRGRIDASLLTTVRGTPGVLAAVGDVMGYARLVGKDGNALGNPQSGAPVLGGSYGTVKQLNPWTLVAGRAPRADNEMVIDRKSSKDGDLNIGDTATVLVQKGVEHMRITGILKLGSADSPGGASVALFTLPVAQKLIAEPGKFDSIDLAATKGVSQAQLVRNLQAVLPAQVEAVTGATMTKESQSAMRKAMSFFNTFMLVFALVALLVGGFIIFNTFSITIAQRTRENGLLRALGATRSQVLRSVLFEAVTVGLLASIVGLAAGVGVAVGLKALLGAVGLDIPTSGVVFTATTAIVCLTAGTTVTLVSALSPARRAGKVSPIAAMQQGMVESAGYGSKKRIFVGLGVLGAGVTALMVGLFSTVSHRVQIVGLGVAFVFFGVSILGRTISLPLSRVIGWPLPRLRGLTGELARENAMRNPKRTAASASALMIGVGLVGFITIFVASSKASINAAVDRAFTGDVIVQSGGGVSGGVDPTMGQRIAKLPEVGVSTAVRIGLAQVDGKSVVLMGADPKTAFAIMDVKPMQGSTQTLGVNAIAVYKDVAKDKHLRLGDQIPVVFKDTGRRVMQVALIYGEHQPAGDYFLGISAYNANFANRLDYGVYVKNASGSTTAQTMAAVRAVARDYPGTKVQDQSQFKADVAKPLNQMLTLVYALLALAILIALLGIANTLALSVFERTRELGLLRAVGMTRSQLRSTIRWESVIIALQGTVLGLVIGVFFGWALVRALKDQGIDVFRIPVTSLVAVVLLAAVAGVVAAVLPGRRAAKLDVLRAVVSD
jgi:putative ABC transport system permease protein